MIIHDHPRLIKMNHGFFGPKVGHHITTRMAGPKPRSHCRGRRIWPRSESDNPRSRRWGYVKLYGHACPPGDSTHDIFNFGLLQSFYSHTSLNKNSQLELIILRWIEQWDFGPSNHEQSMWTNPECIRSKSGTERSGCIHISCVYIYIHV